MNYEQARFNMVEQQIRTWNVLDPEILQLISEVHREDFVPSAYRNLAFVDMEIPLGHGEHMLTPKLEARIVQELAIQKSDNVLEIGTGSGYMTALLARRAHHVFSVEIVPEFRAQAAERLAAHEIRNVTLEEGDGARGWDRHGAVDVIVLTGSVPVLPDAFAACLAPGGRLLAVVGDAPVMSARLVTCLERGQYRAKDLFETSLPPLRNALQPDRFHF